MNWELENSDMPAPIILNLSKGRSTLMSLDWTNINKFEAARRYFNQYVKKPVELYITNNEDLGAAELYCHWAWRSLSDSYQDFLGHADQRNNQPLGGRQLINWTKTNFPTPR